MIVTNLRASTGSVNGTALNFFDIWPLDSTSSIFQIDGNFGTPAAMVEMLVYSRPGHIELLPALPAAWAAHGQITGVGARGGFTVDVSWLNGKVQAAVIHSVGGLGTAVVAGGVTQTVRLAAGQSTTLRWQ
jgi:alpha-L-fucosidase 2